MGAQPTAGAGLNYRLLLPMLGAAMLLQMAVPLMRVATSYRAIELSMSAAQIGLLSAAFALLPVLFAVRIGRHNDRHGEGGTALAGALIVVLSTFGLWFWSDAFLPMLAFTCILGIGQVMSISAYQMVTTRCSGPQQHDRVLGMFLVATSCGHVLGPLVLGLATPAGALYPDPSLYWMMAASTLLMLGCAALLWRSLPTNDTASETPPVNLAEIIRTPGLLIIMLSSSVCLATNDLMIVFFPVLGTERNIDAATVGFLLSLRAVASVCSRLAFSRFVARVGRVNLMLIALLATGSATAILVIDVPLWVLGFAMATAGFTMGLAVACSLSLTLAIAPAGGKATAMSLRLTASRLGQFALPLGAGAAAALLGPGSMFALMGICLLGCGALAGRLRAIDGS